jgi:hypothetical protein
MPAWAVAWSGNLVYTASGSIGLVVRDASAPRAPVVIGINGLKDYDRTDTLFANQPLALSVYVSGPIVYVGTTNSYATVFGLDVRDPRNPRIVYVERYGNATSAQAILTFGSIANWMLMGGGGYPLDAVGIYDVSSPGNVILPVPVQTQPGDIRPLD